MQELDKAEGQVQHATLGDMLEVMKQEVQLLLPSLKPANLVGKVLRRLVELQPFVKFKDSDIVARGMIMQATFDVLALLECRVSLLESARCSGAACFLACTDCTDASPLGLGKCTLWQVNVSVWWISWVSVCLDLAEDLATQEAKPILDLV